MRLGILSDTHGKVAATAAALDLLRQAGSEFYIHCGDVGGEPILDLLASLPLVFVWGNTDFDQAELGRYAKNLGLDCRGNLADLDLDSRRIAVTHGDEPAILKRITAEKRHQYLLHGHTHVARDQMIGNLRWINPGAVHRSPRPSVAVLDTRSEKLEFIPLNVPSQRTS
jgi:putative phosphoesterase